jgi:Biotin-lipoyl like
VSLHVDASVTVFSHRHLAHIAALVWARWGTIDIVASATGKIVPSGRTKVIQPFETGVVRSIRAQDGQAVKAGDVLIELDPTVNAAERDHLHNNLLAEELNIARLRAALAGGDDPAADFTPRADADPIRDGTLIGVIFNDPVPIENPALQAVLMALEMREAIGALTEKWRRLGHDIGFGIGVAHGFATLGTIGFEGRFDYAAIGTVSNVVSALRRSQAGANPHHSSGVHGGRERREGRASGGVRAQGYPPFPGGLQCPGRPRRTTLRREPRDKL